MSFNGAAHNCHDGSWVNAAFSSTPCVLVVNVEVCEPGDRDSMLLLDCIGDSLLTNHGAVLFVR